jgi:hypothetical protein
MYGQTEATARLTFLQPERLPSSARSACHYRIELQVRDQQASAGAATGEICAARV